MIGGVNDSRDVDEVRRREESLARLDETMVALRAFRAGDTGARDRLFTRYAGVVARIVATRLGRTRSRFADVEDIAQDALLRAFMRLDDFEARGEGAFRSWLARIVENEIRDAWRRDRTERRGGGRVRHLSELAVEEHSAGAGASPSQVYAGRELEEQREAALLGLGEFQRELINLREHCEMTFDEIAEELDLRSPDAARMAYNRASAALQGRVRGARGDSSC